MLRSWHVNETINECHASLKTFEQTNMCMYAAKRMSGKGNLRVKRKVNKKAYKK